jgi:hypothetical protein
MSSGVTARRSASAALSSSGPSVSQTSSAALQAVARQKRKRLAMLEAENFADTDEGRTVARKRDSELGFEVDDEYVSQAQSSALQAKKSKKEKFATAAAAAAGQGKGKGKGGGTAGLAPSSAPLLSVLSHSSIEAAHRNRRPLIQLMAEQWPEHYELYNNSESSQVEKSVVIDSSSCSWFSAAASPSVYPSRPFCAVCGYTSKYNCTRCNAKYCSMKCMKIHQDTRCQKFLA